MFPTLGSIQDDIEASIYFETNHWANIGTWAFFQAFHGVAKRLRKNNAPTLRTREVRRDIINSKILVILESDDWEKERNEYRGL